MLYFPDIIPSSHRTLHSFDDILCMGFGLLDLSEHERVHLWLYKDLQLLPFNSPRFPLPRYVSLQILKILISLFMCSITALYLASFALKAFCSSVSGLFLLP